MVFDTYDSTIAHPMDPAMLAARATTHRIVPFSPSCASELISFTPRKGGRIVSVAAIIAVAVDTDGRWEIVGCTFVRPSKDVLVTLPQELGASGARSCVRPT